MDVLFAHINANKFIYALLISVATAALLYWLSRYFATKKELEKHIAIFELHRQDFRSHQGEHYSLRDTVLMLDNTVKHLPTAAESNAMREEMASLRGKLEGTEPLFKQILQNQNLLIENELRGDKK